MHDVRPIECDRTRQFVSVSLDERLSPFEWALVHAHLDECEPCRLYEARVRHLTTALRTAPAERLASPLQLPTRATLAWRSATRVASVGAAAAVAVVAVVGFAAAPDRSAWRGGDARASSALESSDGTNELLIDIVRPLHVGRENQALAYGIGGIGAFKPPLAPVA